MQSTRVLVKEENQTYGPTSGTQTLLLKSSQWVSCLYEIRAKGLWILSGVKVIDIPELKVIRVKNNQTEGTRRVYTIL